MSTVAALGWTVLLLAANAWFVASEFALVASRLSKLELLAEAGSRRARIALEAKVDGVTHLAGALLGITMASLSLGFVAEAAIADLLSQWLHDLIESEALRHGIALVIALAVVVFAHIVLGEMVPKNLALVSPERALVLMTPVNAVVFGAMKPLILFVNWLGRSVTRLFGFTPTGAAASVYTSQELASMLEESHHEGHLDEYERALLTGAFDFGAQSVGSVMVPRQRVVWVPRRATIDLLEGVVASSGHSRIPVVGAGGIDDIIGFVHAKDLLRLPDDARSDPVPLELVRRMLVVRADETLEQVLLAMKRLRIHLAVVQDQSTRTLGIATLEDVLQVLVRELSEATDSAAG